MKGRIGDKQRLLHILDAISEIENYITNVDFNTFLSNSMMRFASIKQIEIIGEAANLITQETKDKFTNIDWRPVIGMRHILVHEYFGIDNNLLWQVIIDDIPKFKIEVLRIIALVDNDI